MEDERGDTAVQNPPILQEVVEKDTEYQPGELQVHIEGSSSSHYENE